MSKFNINAKCRVTLTDFGISILQKRNPVTFQYNFCKEDAVLETELWNVMAIFGDSLYMGATEIPFFENNIELDT